MSVTMLIRILQTLFLFIVLFTWWQKKECLSTLNVGMTGLEPATPWSQTRYTTNCTTSRLLLILTTYMLFLNCECKGIAFSYYSQTFWQKTSCKFIFSIFCILQTVRSHCVPYYIGLSNSKHGYKANRHIFTYTYSHIRLFLGKTFWD